MTLRAVCLSFVLLSLAGCHATLGGRTVGDAAIASDAHTTRDGSAVDAGLVEGDAATGADAAIEGDAWVTPGTDAAIEPAEDAAVIAVDAWTPPATTEMCPVGPAATRTYPSTWTDGECIVQWSHDRSITRARYWTSPSGERVLYAEMGTNFCSADLLGNLLGTIDGRWAALAFPNTPPWEGGRSQPMPDCARFTDGQHIATWSFDGSDIRARRTSSGVLYAENNSGGSYNFVPGHWVGAAGGTGMRNEDLCFAETMP